MISVAGHTEIVDGLTTSYLEAGSGTPVVLVHGGEFGGSAELSWERIIAPLAEDHRVVAPDLLGFGGSAKTVDFVEGRGFRLRHIAALCAKLGIGSADFVGSSMGGAMLLADAASAEPILPARSLVSICGGGELLKNEHMAAIMDFDGTLEGMRRIVEAMFSDPAYLEDETYIERRLESSLLPGAWEAVASARFRRPGHVSSSTADPEYGRISIPSLIIEADRDKLKPPGWAGRLAGQIPGARSTVVSGSAHFPQLEQPEATVALLREHLALHSPS
jgi:pimeloyl-ACP methyl ester carboxylesterase